MSRSQRDLTAHLIEIAEKLEYEKAQTTLADLGYKSVSYSWLKPETEKWHVNDGKKMQKKEESPPLQAVFPASRSGRPQSAPQRGRRNQSPGDDEEEEKGEEEKKKKKNTGVPEKLRRLLKGVTEYDAGQNRLRIMREKEAAKLKLRSNAPLVNKDGVACEFDYHGHLVPKGHVKIVTRKPSTAFVNKHYVAPQQKFTGEIINKTKNFIERNKEREAQDQVEVITWRPSLLPGTTYSSSPENVVLPPSAFVPTWGEYSALEEGDVMVTIEHCACCEDHSETLRHNSKQYRALAEKFRISFIGLFSQYPIRFGVAFHTFEEWEEENRFLRVDGNGRVPRPSGIIFDVDVSNRIGAFEIQIAVQTKDRRENHVLFSKLFRGAWPNQAVVMRATQHLLEEQCGFIQLPPKSMDLPTGESNNPIFCGDNRGHPTEKPRAVGKRRSARGNTTFGSMLNFLRGGSRQSVLVKRGVQVRPSDDHSQPHSHVQTHSHGAGRHAPVPVNKSPVPTRAPDESPVDAAPNARPKLSPLVAAPSPRFSAAKAPAPLSALGAITEDTVDQSSRCASPALVSVDVRPCANSQPISLVIPTKPSPVATNKPMPPSQMMALQLDIGGNDDDDNDSNGLSARTNASMIGSGVIGDPDETPMAHHDRLTPAGVNVGAGRTVRKFSVQNERTMDSSPVSSNAISAQMEPQAQAPVTPTRKPLGGGTNPMSETGDVLNDSLLLGTSGSLHMSQYLMDDFEQSSSYIGGNDESAEDDALAAKLDAMGLH